jgi:hypothetical protein
MNRFFYASIIFVSVALLMAACTATVRINTVQPAAVNIPKEFKKVLLINRTGEDPNYKQTNKIEKMLSGDWSKRNPRNTFKVLEGLGAELTNSMKNYQVQILKDTIFMGTGNVMFPEYLKPDFIDSLANKYEADFVIALETFDMDMISKVNGAPVTFNVVGIVAATPMGPTYTILHVTKLGWRIYPVGGGSLIDQHQHSYTMDFQRMGIPDQTVLLQLPKAKEGVNVALFDAGSFYGDRITPHPITLVRQFFTSGSSSIKQGARLAHLGKWDEAADRWAVGTKSGRRKVGKRSYYNMAVYYEVMGNLDEAIKMAETSYSVYGFREGLRYSNMLKHRRNMARRVDEQAGE